MAQKSIQVLHVEDDETDALMMQQSLNECLSPGGIDIIQVDSLKLALKSLTDKGCDVVLLDLNLRDVSGVDNIAAIKEQNPDIPIVVLSGIDHDATAIEAIDRGAQEYLVKGLCNGKVIQLAIRSSIKRKSVERRLFKQANYDELTGLANRRFFQECLEKALYKAKRWKRHETLLFIDLDNFKAVNDTYGHEAGNHVLREASQRMHGLIRASDTIARYGGDEFLILLDDRSEDYRISAGHAATKLLYAFNDPFIYEGHAIDCSISIGAATYPAAGEDYASLIKQADIAMYQAKQAGGRQFKFAPTAGMNARSA